MELTIFQKGFNYSQDGPGNRLVYHLQGCNMRCPWCANPDGIAFGGSVVTVNSLLLDDVCPRGAIANQRLDRSVCADCGDRLCLDRKTKGIFLSCRSAPVETILEEVERSRAMFFDGGGVTFTGGEPTCQFQAVEHLLRNIRNAGVSTAVETNGANPRLPELLPFVDHLMFDVKHWDETPHKAATGIGLHVIRDNLNHVSRRKRQVAFRIPLVDGFNASAADIDGFLALFASLDMAAATVELLPFHEYGRDKWIACGLEYRMNGGRVETEIIRKFRDAFAAAGLRLIKT